jgi:hypothetical protein
MLGAPGGKVSQQLASAASLINWTCFVALLLAVKTTSIGQHPKMKYFCVNSLLGV